MQEAPELMTVNDIADVPEFAEALRDARENRITWITDMTGKRIAALVPVEVAEHYEGLLSAVLQGRHHQAEPAQS
jgi:hypothetical protein